jgi:hypothetical protein
MNGDVPRIMFVSYTGAYPNLCSGVLTLEVDGRKAVFGGYSLISGGSVWFDNDWSEHVDRGGWRVRDECWPPIDVLPESLRDEAIRVINDNIDYGCCGGCV